MDSVADTVQARAEPTGKSCTLKHPGLLTCQGITAPRFKPKKNVRTSTQTIRNIVKQTAEKAGLGTLSSPDIRFTSLTLFSGAGDSVAGDSSPAES